MSLQDVEVCGETTSSGENNATDVALYRERFPETSPGKDAVIFVCLSFQFFKN